MIGGGIHLHVGIIFTTVPYTNSYFVQLPAFGRVTATTSEEGSADRRGSTGGGISYLPGTRVIVACPETGYEDSLSTNIPFTILGGLSQFPKVIETEHTPQGVLENPSDFNNNPAYDILTDADYEKTLRQDRSFNRLLESLPGDWTKTNALGAILNVSMFLTSIGSGPDCKLTFHGIDRTAEMTADQFIRSSHSFLEYIYSEGKYSLRVEQIASTPCEGLGGKSADPMDITDTEPPALKEDTQRSLMRQTSLKGGAVEGELTYTQVPKGDSDTEVYSFSDGMSRAGLTRVQNRTDGIYRVEAAKEIGLYKTGTIRVPQQSADIGTLYPEGVEESKDVYDGQTDVEAKMEALGIQSEEEYYAVKSLLGTSIKNFEEEKYFWRGLRQEGGIWTIPAPGDTDTEVASPGENPQLDSANVTDPEYDFNQLSSIMTEAIEVSPGRKVKLFKNSSMFVMSEEGNITIGDGKGAAIKFENGNLILGSALDIKLQPGRNLVSVVPGNEIKKVGNSYELSTNGSGITLKSEGNLHMVSGNGGSGSTLLENLSSSNNISSTTEKALKAGDPRGGGIFLKSPSAGVNVGAKSFTVAGHPSVSSDGANNDKGYDRAYAKCLISLDAGSDDVSIMGDTGSLLFDKTGVLGHLSSSTGVYVEGGVVTSIADSRISFTTPKVQLGPGKKDSTIVRSKLTREGVRQSSRYKVPTENVQLEIFGGVRASRVIECKEGIITEGAVVANKGCNPTEIPRSQYKTVTMNTIGDNAPTLRDHENSLDKLLKRLVNEGLASEKAYTYSSFTYPESKSPIYNVDSQQSYFSQMPWQKMLDKNGGAWKENYVSSVILGETYPYPGAQAFEEGSKVYRTVESGKVVQKSFDKYVTNVN
jgi:hypothetical protein